MVALNRAATVRSGFSPVMARKKGFSNTLYSIGYCTASYLSNTRQEATHVAAGARQARCCPPIDAVVTVA